MSRRACHSDRREESCFLTRRNRKISRFARNDMLVGLLCVHQVVGHFRPWRCKFCRAWYMKVRMAVSRLGWMLSS